MMVVVPGYLQQVYDQLGNRYIAQAKDRLAGLLIASVIDSSRSHEVIGRDRFMIADKSIIGRVEQQDKHPENNDQPFHFRPCGYR
jgi:hypothetical protein